MKNSQPTMDPSVNHESHVNTIINRLDSWGESPALFFRDKIYSYTELKEFIDQWKLRLQKDGVGQGTICAVFSDFSPQTAALFFALMSTKAILVPITREIQNESQRLLEIAGCEVFYKFDEHDGAVFGKFPKYETPTLVNDFRLRQHAGLIVFTSGSTGKPKGILHDCEQVLYKFLTIRKGWRTVLFLLMDHFGGFNTFISSFAYGGMAVCLKGRTPEMVAEAIEAAKANLLPTTPTFLNLLIAGKYYKNHDLSSIELITYGTEMMPEATLKKIAEVIPNATLKQTYGMSELGVLQSKSEGQDSLWVKIGGAGFETKVVDNILWVRSKANMVGYLNAPQPFDSEGWMCTGDEVESKGEYIRFMGRKSEIINVGGNKVFPAEVENVIIRAGNIKDVTVFASAHPLMGQVVNAKVSVIESEDAAVMTERLRKFCNENLAKYKVPLRFTIMNEDENHHNIRFKKDRQISNDRV